MLEILVILIAGALIGTGVNKVTAGPETIQVCEKIDETLTVCKTVPEADLGDIARRFREGGA